MPKPQILVINPNTSTTITERLRLLAIEVVGEAAEIVAVTAPFGARYISTRSAALIAGHATLDAYALALSAGEAPQALVIACFGDPGLAALREVAPVPVVGFAEAGIKAAAAHPGRFAIATIGSAWEEMLAELVAGLGLSERLAGFILLDDVAGDPGSAARLIATNAQRMGADRVVVGGTGLIPLIPELAQRLSIPITDPHREAIRHAVELVREEAGNYGPAGVAARPGTFGGLSVELTNLLERQDLPPALAIMED